MTTPAGTTSYGYDALDRLSSVGYGGLQTTYEYDAVGFLTDIHRPNGVDTVITPNVRNQVDLITHSNGTTLQSFDYVLDNAGNRTRVTELGGAYITWDYDFMSRLTDEKRFTSGNVQTNHTHFVYDDAGNQDYVTVDGVTTDYTYNSLDQLVSADAITYEYDGRGNLSQITNGSNITDYTYDYADRLANVTLPDTTSIDYVYDADGRRVSQSIDSVVTNNYLWDEASAYGDVVYEYDGIGAALASYVLGGTGLVSQTQSGTTSYFLQDGQGSTSALTNISGSITDSYSYTAFGELFSQSGTTDNNYLYTGQQFDSPTGLYSLRARYYNPALGRFLSQDTYPYNFGNPVELNRYVYVANDPVNKMDPSGLFALTEYAISLGKKTAAFGALYGVGQTLGCGGNLFLNVLSGAASGFAFGVAYGYLPGATIGLGTLIGVNSALSAVQSAEVNGPSSYTCNGFKAVTTMLMVMFAGLGHQQRSLAEVKYSSMAQNENMAVAMRSRLWGAEIWEKLGVPPKPGTVHGGDVIWKGPLGLRLAKSLPGRPWWEVRWFVSDSDPGFFFRDGALIPRTQTDAAGNTFTYWEYLNMKFGTNFQHGSHKYIFQMDRLYGI